MYRKFISLVIVAGLILPSGMTVTAAEQTEDWPAIDEGYNDAP